MKQQLLVRPASMAGPRSHQRRGSPERPHALLSLQRSAGNAAVGRLVAGMAVPRGALQRMALELEESVRDEEAQGDQEVLHPERGDDGPAPAPAPRPAPASGALRKGSTGPKVREAQQQLNDLGASPVLDPDGRFGARTEAAVQAFQRSHRLRPDGVIGVATATMLGNEHALHAAEPGAAPCHTPEDPGPDSGFDRDGGGGDVVRLDLTGDVVGDSPAGVRVVIKLTNDPSKEKTASDLAEMAAFGGVQETALSIAALQAVLAKHPNISTLGLLSHGTPQGQILIGDKLVSLSELSAQLQQRPAGSIGSVEFLGCSVGNDKAGLGEFKKRAGAKDSQGVTCNMRTVAASPVTEGGTGKKLTSVNAIRATGSLDVAGAIRQNARVAMGSGSRTACIFGFPPGVDSIDSVKDEVLFKLYDDNKGVLTAKFTSNTCETCFQALSFDTPDLCDCKKVQA